MVYADSLSPVSADKFKFTTSKDYPGAMADFAQALQRLETMPCDVLITPHPEVSDFFARIAARSADKPESLRAEGGCRQFAQGARAKLEQRMASEQ
jgi:metallo-beta-lactamase class B